MKTTQFYATVIINHRHGQTTLLSDYCGGTRLFESAEAALKAGEDYLGGVSGFEFAAMQMGKVIMPKTLALGAKGNKQCRCTGCNLVRARKAALANGGASFSGRKRNDTR